MTVLPRLILKIQMHSKDSTECQCHCYKVFFVPNVTNCVNWNVATMHTDIANALIDVEASTESTFKNESNQFTTLATNTINMMEMPITTRAPNTISMPLFSFTGDLITYYIPFITFAGTIGNVLSVLVFVRSKLKKLSSSYYLAALSISDTGYLLCNFAQWINTWNINIYNRDGFCQLFTFLSSMCTAFSAWLVVAFTVERFIVVRYPLKRQTMCTVRRAKCVLIVLLLLSIVHCAPLLRISEARHDKQYNEMTCDIRPSTKVYIWRNNFMILWLCFSQSFGIKTNKYNWRSSSNFVEAVSLLISWLY